MLLKLYSILIIFLDVLILFIRTTLALFERVYEILVPPPEKPVSGEIVLITGTGHGIGRELALQFGALGATLVCVDINTKGNDETITMCKEMGYKKVSAYTCDVSERDDVVATVKKITEEVGPVSVLVNNAGIMPCHSFLDHTPEEITKIFKVNLFAHFWLLEEVLPRMIKNNHGHVVAISSMAGILGLRNLVPYCSSKFAVRGLMEALAEEVRLDGKAPDVHFTCIFPYMVNTGLCKKPRARFPSMLSMVGPKEAAAHIIRAMRRNAMYDSIPSWYLQLNDVIRMYPLKVGALVKDFLEVELEAD